MIILVLSISMHRLHGTMSNIITDTIRDPIRAIRNDIMRSMYTKKEKMEAQLVASMSRLKTN